ncbi:MAG TPA: hypothetical protein VNL14_06315 [Candidatus Acidoferrales bacterium]|nr:hypothetical protein [Candidatus Acidoferrales bacterium]
MKEGFLAGTYASDSKICAQTRLQPSREYLIFSNWRVIGGNCSVRSQASHFHLGRWKQREVQTIRDLNKIGGVGLRQLGYKVEDGDVKTVTEINEGELKQK